MTNNHESVRDVWDFEKYCCSKPVHWIHLAWNLKCSYLVLSENSKLAFKYRFDENEKEPLIKNHFWSSGTERMLIGFSLENMVKAILLLNKEVVSNIFKKEGNLSWSKDGHNLIKLYAQTSLEITDVEKRFLELWQTCSLWAGRYPISVNENHIPRQRKSMPTREALIKRSKKRVEKALEENDPLMGAELGDLLHSGIGSLEHQTFINLYERSNKFLEDSCSLPEPEQLKCWSCHRVGCTI